MATKGKYPRDLRVSLKKRNVEGYIIGAQSKART